MTMISSKRLYHRRPETTAKRVEDGVDSLYQRTLARLVNIPAQQGNTPYSRCTNSYCYCKSSHAGSQHLVDVELFHKSKAAFDRPVGAP